MNRENDILLTMRLQGMPAVDIEYVRKAFKKLDALPAQPSATHTAACELLSALEDIIPLAGNAPWSEDGKSIWENAKEVAERYNPLLATTAPVAQKVDQHGDCLCCCRKHGGRGFTQGCVKCEQERTAAQSQEEK